MNLQKTKSVAFDELLHKIDKNSFVLVKDPTDGKKMTGLVPSSAIWGA